MPNVCLRTTDTGHGDIAGDRRFRFVTNGAVLTRLLF
jgi:hypothetical protein